MSKKLTKEEFIKKSEEKHGDKYDYSLVEYAGTNNKVKIICREHGEFLQRSSAHLYGQGCMGCRLEGRRTGLENFLKKSIETHGDKYDYSLVKEYQNSLTKVNIICKKHGNFKISPHKHLCGQGCPKCKKLDIEAFIERSNLIHGDKYDYSLVKYVNSVTGVEIICKNHGVFVQTPATHIRGNGVGCGCPICKESIGERLISKYLELNNIIFERQKKFNSCKNKSELPFDFYLSELNICVEYNGIQHYESVEYFGGEEKFKQRLINDQIKKEYCYNNNIPLIIIKYNEDVKKILDKKLPTTINSIL